jgi:ABC-2 type transport system permease protein
MRLLGVELDRFRCRRAIVLLLLTTMLLTAFMAVTTVWQTRPVSEADRAAAEALAQHESESEFFRRELARCERDPERFLGFAEATAADCADILPRAEWYLQRRTLDLGGERRGSGAAVTVLLTGLLLVVGTTFAGADWASGSVSNQLLFESRRARVWLAKAGAVLLGSALTAAAMLGGLWLTLYLVAESRGVPTGAAVQAAIRGDVARGIALAAAGAVGAYALTMLLRHTVGTLAVLFTYAVVGEILIATLPVEGIGRWSLLNNVSAWLFGGHSYYDASLPCRPGLQRCDQMATLSLGDGALFLGALLLAVVVSSLISFRRRDIP